MKLRPQLKSILKRTFLLLLPITCLGLGVVVMAQSVSDNSALNNLCNVNNNFICRYLGISGEDAVKRVHDSDRGKNLKLTNTSNKKLFVPNKTRAELDAFLAQKNRLGVTACEEGLRDNVNSVFGGGIKGCDQQCVITPVYGRRCRVKSGFTGKRLANTKIWIDGTAFDWSSSNLNGSGSWNVLDGSTNYLYRGKSNTIGDGNNQRDNCGPSNGHNHKAEMYRPDRDGKWRKYWCSKRGCFNGCDYRWRPVYGFSPVASSEQRVVNASYNPNSYGYTCNHTEYRYSGTYTTRDCSESDTENRPPFLQDGRTDDTCTTTSRSCSDYNYWAKSGESHRSVPQGCSTAGTSGSKTGICYKNCGSQDVASCTSYDSKCEVYNDNSVTYEYSSSCTFDWKIAASGWGTCSTYSGTQYRSVTCKDEANNNATSEKCNANTRPASRQACTAYKWVNDRNYSGCTARCNNFNPNFMKNDLDETNPFAFILVSGVANAEDVYNKMIAPIGGTYTAYGKEYRKARCKKVYDGTTTAANNSFCTNLNKNEPSRTCSITCQGSGNPNPF